MKTKKFFTGLLLLLLLSNVMAPSMQNDYGIATCGMSDDMPELPIDNFFKQ